MYVRILATVLWFAAGWSAAGLLVGLLAWPSPLAVVSGLAVAMVVWFDPAGWIWQRRSQQRRIRPVEEVARELDERAAAPGTAAAGERRRI